MFNDDVTLDYVNTGDEKVWDSNFHWIGRLFSRFLSWPSGISNLDNGYGYDILLIYKSHKTRKLCECTEYQGGRTNFKTKRSISGADLGTCVAFQKDIQKKNHKNPPKNVLRVKNVQNGQILQSSIKSLRKLSRSNQTSPRQVENGLNLHIISLQVKIYSLDFSDFWFLAIYLFFICLSALKYKTRRLDEMTQHPKLFFLDT